MKSFFVQCRQTERVPIVVSLPHGGTYIPESIQSQLDPQIVEFLEDTDWHVSKLYNFVVDMGVTLIESRVSRYVIDLNRGGEPLYAERTETPLIPQKTFLGHNVYLKPVEQTECENRLKQFYWPYYHEIEKHLLELKQKFKKVLFFDGHSIKNFVPAIQKSPFPDLILGSRDETSAHQTIIQRALDVLKKSSYQVSHNHPFKGGNLTRYFGRPLEGYHALQLEMSQKIYMNETNNEFLPEKAELVQNLLKKLFAELIQELT